LSADPLRGRAVLDTGVLVEMLSGTPAGARVADALAAGALEAAAAGISFVEAEYVLCRKIGSSKAAAKLDALRRSNFVAEAAGREVDRGAAALKCGRRISLADCYCIAAAEVNRSKALFMARERELARELERKPFGVEVAFLGR
jgi:uncharacterized protein